MALKDVQDTIRRVAKEQGLDEQAVEQLIEPNKKHEFELKLKGGQSYKAYRVQHDNRRGPYKGGLRFHPTVYLGLLKFLRKKLPLPLRRIPI